MDDDAPLVTAEVYILTLSKARSLTALELHMYREAASRAAGAVGSHSFLSWVQFIHVGMRESMCEEAFFGLEDLQVSDSGEFIRLTYVTTYVGDFWLFNVCRRLIVSVDLGETER